MRPYVPAWSTCPHAHVPTCQHAKSVITSHFYVPINLPTCQSAKGVPVFNLACQCAKRRANKAYIMRTINLAGKAYIM